MAYNVAPGHVIYAVDGDELGTVKEVDGDLFKIDAPMARDYWLDYNRISGEFQNGFQVDFRRADLDQYKLKAEGD